ncbi:acetyl-CoA carboxylase, biotin carboxyl carrier protein [Pacificimonas flava]|uniref:Biotin carboxyl carrier protein of acetyl-CoA carboxylase n=2 Tax=Pacificimonas TaxID=1960290 RepID=A0A219B2F5_9SPHN|nr:acetyl-CoA carboxylase biotin carboxyl carrier protein [Pacificimonas aurantium]OWV32542.1 acetyl-CoA carboxylase, biotin carboxyl carrier protein [Pacificimonas flava]
MSVDTALVRELAELLGDTGLSEIEVEDGDRKIRVARKLQAAAAAAPAYAPASAPPAAAPAAESAAPAETAQDLKAHPGAVKSPMVGTAYMSPEPGKPPFVSPGSQVAAGDTLLIVEAMKVMNPITAPKAGTVKQVCVENEEPVEYDQVLLIVE